ncbi:hypothetical protein DPMN_075940 [Dreissena polymorpha]|uniref:Uncharacterized protein n=1 Tax=Dreissena polymorpha TaxID=45954 RepID=A0A9D3YLC8_DREPO|nr:hypothetical protein DPMN_075940 [Dreissena polymorpha]
MSKPKVPKTEDWDLEIRQSASNASIHNQATTFQVPATEDRDSENRKSVSNASIHEQSIFQIPKTEDWDMEIRQSEMNKNVNIRVVIPKTEDWDAEIAVAKRPPFYLSVRKAGRKGTKRELNHLHRCLACGCMPVNCLCYKN